MAMEKRVGFVLDADQVEQACEAFIAARLQADEEARAKLVIEGPRVAFRCTINVSKKRKPRAKKKLDVSVDGKVDAGAGGKERVAP